MEKRKNIIKAKKEVFDDIERLQSYKLGSVSSNSIKDLKKKHLSKKQ